MSSQHYETGIVCMFASDIYRNGSICTHGANTSCSSDTEKISTTLERGHCQLSSANQAITTPFIRKASYIALRSFRVVEIIQRGKLVRCQAVIRMYPHLKRASTSLIPILNVIAYYYEGNMHFFDPALTVRVFVL